MPPLASAIRLYMGWHGHFEPNYLGHIMNNFPSSRRRQTSLRISSANRLRSRAVVKPSPSSVVRYAVVGLGHIAQVAVLPAFAHARRNSRLVALFSNDPVKREELAKRYQIANL